jgi:hypothetical protein
MQLPDTLIKTGIALEDRYCDLRGLSVYSSLGLSSLRHHIKENGLPCYSVRNNKGQVTKVLVKLSEFDAWMARKWKLNIEEIANQVLKDFQSDCQSGSHGLRMLTSKGKASSR